MLAPLLPNLHHYDPDNHVLVLELLPPETEDFREYFERLERFGTDLAGEELGSALGTYHAGITLARGNETPDVAVFPKCAPWILSFHHQSFPTSELARSLAQLRTVLQDFAGFAERLDQLRTDWRIDCLIHGDIRWENCLLYPDPAHGGRLHFKLIDWETADFGDACWDIGGVLQAYLSSWVFSMPDGNEIPARELVARARYPMDQMQSAVDAFWRAYISRRGLAERASRDLLIRSMTFAAARLVQTAGEFSMHGAQLSQYAVRLLQLSYNILESPSEGVERLLVA